VFDGTWVVAVGIGMGMRRVRGVDVLFLLHWESLVGRCFSRRADIGACVFDEVRAVWMRTWFMLRMALQGCGICGLDLFWVFFVGGWIVGMGC